MKNIGKIEIIFVLVIIVVEGFESERRLLDQLFQKYCIDERPVNRHNQTTDVIIKYTLEQIIQLNEKEEYISTRGWFTLKWKDDFLRWDPEMHQDIKSITVKATKLWVPDIVLYNDANGDMQFNGNLDQFKHRLTISHTGKISWGLRGIFTTRCQVDVQNFPFDNQTCLFRLGSWSYRKGEIDVSNKSRIKTDYYVKNNGWDLIEATETLYPGEFASGKYDYVVFKIAIKRRSLLYSLNWILPTVIIALLALLSFLLPAESGERLALSITLLLAKIFFMVGVIELIPNNSECIPHIYKFFIATMIEMALLIVTLCFIMQLHHKQSVDPPMSFWTRRFILDKLSYCMGVREYPKEAGILCKRLVNGSLGGLPLAQSEMQVCLRKKKNLVNIRIPRMSALSQRTLSLNKSDVRNLYMMSDDQIFKREWRIVALTVDRCSFCFFTTAYLIILIIFLSKGNYVF